MFPDGTDLDNITDIGNYYCNSNDLLSSLKNCPASYAFIMKVYSGTGGTASMTQYIEDYMFNRYMRRYRSSVWSDWEELPRSIISTVNLSLESGFSSSSYEYDQPVAKKVGNIVFLSGLIQCTDNTASTVCTLPEGYRPFNQYARFLLPIGTSTNSQIVQINYRGVMSFQNITYINSWVSLNGISFIAEN